MRRFAIYDKGNDELDPRGWDGSEMIFDGGGFIRVKELGCNCEPGSGCGGCVDEWRTYELNRSDYVMVEIDNEDNIIDKFEDE